MVKPQPKMSNGKASAEKAGPRPPKRAAAIKARPKIAKGEKEAAKYMRDAAVAKKGRAKAAIKSKASVVTKSRGNRGEHNLSMRNTWGFFPGVGQCLIDGQGTHGKSSSAAGAEKGRGDVGIIGMNYTCEDAQPLLDFRMQGMLASLQATQATFQDKRLLSQYFKSKVEEQSRNNMNVKKMNSLLLGTAKIEVVKGGTKFGDGVFLGIKADYEETAPSNNKGKSPPDWRLCLAKWGGKEKELFVLASKNDVIESLLYIYGHDYEHYLLSHENFPRLKDLFWSIGYHYRDDLEKSGVCSLLELLEFLCPDNDWKSIPGLAGRKGKGKRGNY